MVCICAAGSYPLITWASPGVVKSAVAGGVIATVNILAGYATIEYSVGKSMNTFMKFVFGGMGVRLFVMAGLLLVLTRVFGFQDTALVVSLGVFYLPYLVLELVFIQRKLNVRQSS
jgi:hypothetical protein